MSNTDAKPHIEKRVSTGVIGLKRVHPPWPPLLQGVKESKERAAREEMLLKQYEAQEAERLAAAAAEKRLKAARLQADIEQVCGHDSAPSL